jgi:cytochrome c oxidase subunit II
MGEPNHARRFVTLWVIGTLIALPISIFLIGPELGAPHGSVGVEDQARTMTILAAIATPVLVLVGLYLLYAIVFFRQPRGAALEGPAVRGDSRIQTTWLVVTSVLVLAIAVYGSVTLVSGYGVGSGSGPSPLSTPSGKRLRVQVIAQQWAFTYRWPEYGGVETPHLVLPVNTWVEFNVTSLDVIHSFWAYQLGVKADANPSENNIAFAKPNREQVFEIRCSELCGIWHGAMFDHGKVVSRPAFETWIRSMQVKFAAATKVLPPYSTTYLPEPRRRGG